jgi:hypothetical protein
MEEEDDEEGVGQRAAGISKKMEWRVKGLTVGKTVRLRETDDEGWLVEMAQAWGRRGM